MCSCFWTCMHKTCMWKMCVTHTNASYKTFSPWSKPVTKEEFNYCLLNALRKTQNFATRENRARLQEPACRTVPETEAGWSMSLSSLGGLGDTGWAWVLNKPSGSPCHDLLLQVMVCHQKRENSESGWLSIMPYLEAGHQCISYGYCWSDHHFLTNQKLYPQIR